MRFENNEKYRKKVCARCKSTLIDGDAYCRTCGSKRDEVVYEFTMDEFQCIYGPPPVDRKHICRKCGYTWINCMMVDDEKFCPKCGCFVTVQELK